LLNHHLAQNSLMIGADIASQERFGSRAAYVGWPSPVRDCEAVRDRECRSTDFGRFASLAVRPRCS